MPELNHNSEQVETNELEQGLATIIRPFQSFIRNQKAGSLLLLASSIIALIIANTPYQSLYENVIQTELGFLVGSRHFAMSLHHWINDGLMALFFFIIGLEIKRELLAGELRNPANALPVIAGAFGGMLVPALIFYSLNTGTETLQGWAIPMATDTAFAIGLLLLLGQRVPGGLLTFLLALAIIDDIGAVIVIALFYSDTLLQSHLVIGFSLLLILFLGNRAGIRHPFFYFIIGGFIWLSMLGSGVHASLAGILIAMTIPARPAKSGRGFLRHSVRVLRRFREIEERAEAPSSMLSEPEKHELVETLHKSARDVTTPLQRWEQRLENPVSLLVLPIFALVNAGIAVSIDTLHEAFTSLLSLGIIFGLIIGKFFGISVFTWLIVKLGWGKLPGDMPFRYIPGLALMAGIGFTMSVYIAQLGFGDSPQQLLLAKSGIILASLIAGTGGYIWLSLLGKADNR